MQNEKDTYQVLGIMSGTSMDGVDLAYCTFSMVDGKWSYAIQAGETIPFDEKWRVRLSQLTKQSALTYVKTHTFFGHYIGKLCADFIQKYSLQVDFIASHGHTIFHQPALGYTAQIGDGAAIAAVSGLPVICDFRLMDVALYGQGAPLVPIGDRDLFGEYDYCLNLGGFANVSSDRTSKRIAYDIAPCNIILNRIARNLGQLFDDEGQIAATGQIHIPLVEELNELPYYQLPAPKSMGREWINSDFWPTVRKYELDGVAQADLMRSLSEHVAHQISASIGSKEKKSRVLITGGGAYNKFLIGRLKELNAVEWIVPESSFTIDFKEALIFAYLGVLRLRQEVNALATVTGAKKDSIGGAMWGDFSKMINNK